MSDEFVAVANLSEVPDPGKRLFEVNDRLVVVFHVDGEVSCIDDICTHDGGPLSDGELDGETISCPRHGARFDIKCGKALTMPATEDTAAHEAKVEDGIIFVRIVEQ